MKVITATGLRQNLYRILDEVLETGKPVIVQRKGKRIRVAPEVSIGKLDRLEPHQVLVGDPEEIVHLDWSSAWGQEPNL